MNLTNPQFQVNEKVIIARASDGDPAAAAYLIKHMLFLISMVTFIISSIITFRWDTIYKFR